MAAVNINRITNANVYVAGNSLLGMAEEVTLPAIKAKYADVKVLGLQSDLELPTGLEKMTGKVKWNALYPDVINNFGSPYVSQDIQVKSNLEIWDSSGRTNQVPVTAYMTVRFKDALASINIKSGDNPEQESEFSCTYFRLEIDGQTVIEVDVFNNVYFIGDIDQVINYRNNLGL